MREDITRLNKDYCSGLVDWWGFFSWSRIFTRSYFFRRSYRPLFWKAEISCYRYSDWDFWSFILVTDLIELRLKIWKLYLAMCIGDFWLELDYRIGNLLNSFDKKDAENRQKINSKARLLPNSHVSPPSFSQIPGLHKQQRPLPTEQIQTPTYPPPLKNLIPPTLPLTNPPLHQTLHPKAPRPPFPIQSPTPPQRRTHPTTLLNHLKKQITPPANHGTSRIRFEEYPEDNRKATFEGKEREEKVSADDDDDGIYGI